MTSMGPGEDLEMEIVFVIEWFSVRSSIQTEVGIDKKGSSCHFSVHYMEAYLIVALFCSLENKMGIPNTLLMLLTIASRLFRIRHALKHLLWPFLSQSIALRFPQNVCFFVVQLSNQWAAYLLLQAFIYPRQTASQPTYFSHKHYLVHIQPMENINFSSNFQDMENQARSSMVYTQNDHQKDSIPSASFMPLTHFQPTSYYPQIHNQNLEFPYVLLPEHQAQSVLPACTYQFEGSEMRSGAHNLSPNCFPSGVLSNALPRDMPEGAYSMQQLGTSDIEEQRKIYLSTCKAARANRMRKRQINAGVQMKSSGVHSSCSSSIFQNDNKKLRLLLQKQLTSSDVGSNGRIILPKKNAERSLPNLSSKEGIMVVIRDVRSNYGWRMRYGFWENHRGRMYILDQCGDFVNQNRLASGDILNLYVDERKELYFSVQKTNKLTPTPTPSNEQNYPYYTYTRTLFGEEATEEENSSLQILMEEFKDLEQLDTNNLMNL